MARPLKPRFSQGAALPDNLYPDARKRENHWRYRRPDGTYKIFAAQLEEAIALAAEANCQRDQINPARPRKVPDRASFTHHAGSYKQWRELNDPRLKGKASWTNRCNALNAFAEDFAYLPVHKTKLANLRTWWETLTYHQQHARRAEFNKFYNYLMAEGLTPQLESNPFTTADDRPRLLEKGKPAKKRQRLTMEAFWKIYHQAGNMGLDALQIAMGVSLVTTMRRTDICEITLEHHIDGGQLRKTINKSEAQRDSTAASHLSWNLKSYPLLGQLVKRARECSMRNLRCPYLLSHTPKQRRTGKTKDHIAQVSPDRLSDMFTEARNATGLFNRLESNQTPPTFHEVRSLASDRFKRMGYDIKDVQRLMAHTDEKVTRHYQSGHGIEYQEIGIYLDEQIIGGTF